MTTESEYGVAGYTAEQVGGSVIVHAVGETPTAGYRVWLQQAPGDAFPPSFELYWLPPNELAADVLTPFQVHATFSTSESVPRVTVRDADGAHTIRVEQVPD